MKIHLIDGTYELFRHYYALPSHINRHGEEVGAVRGVLSSILSLLENGASHIAVATDHVIESFRNRLWPDYKDGSGIERPLRSQFHLLEDALRSAGFVVWPMIEYEADDALAAGAAAYAKDHRVEQIFICTPDKDLAQCVRENRIVQFDRRRKRLYDRTGVIEKFGVAPEFIPDYLALVGDSADGYPGLRGWGPVSAASAIRRYGHLEEMPVNVLNTPVKRADRYSAKSLTQREIALLFKRLATLVTEGVIDTAIDQLAWSAPADSFGGDMCDRLELPSLLSRIQSFRVKMKV